MKFLKSFPKKIRSWILIVGGIFVGLVIYTLYASRVASYLSDDPKACVNCHIMSPEYATWQHSSHREVAVCNDCHVPHNNIFNKYFFKAKDGFLHASVFTLRMEPQVISMRDASANVVQANCVRCHYQLNQKINNVAITVNSVKHGEGKMCWECHRAIAHGDVHSLSSITKRMTIPILQNESQHVPDWLIQMIKK